MFFKNPDSSPYIRTLVHISDSKTPFASKNPDPSQNPDSSPWRNFLRNELCKVWGKVNLKVIAAIIDSPIITGLLTYLTF